MSSSGKNLILGAFEAALSAASPSAAVQRAIQRLPSGSVQIAGAEFAPGAAFEVIAIGKAAPAMANGIVEAIGPNQVRRGFVLTTEGQDQIAVHPLFERHVGSHPVLDERSIRATERLLTWLEEIDPGAPVICLISGGGSALLEAPVDGVSLADFQETTRTLLRAGADIHQLNAVRTQISRVKGGGLRSLIPSRRVVTLLVSDVLGNDLGVIASGPTVAPGTTASDARRVIAELDIEARLPASVRQELNNPKRSVPGPFPDDVVEIVADNRTALTAAQAFLEQNGCRVQALADTRTGEARESAREWVRHLRATEADAVLAGGELTVTVRGEGTGGRNTEFALAAAIELEALGLADWTVASLATDGQDALTGAAGAIVDARTAAQLRALGFDPEQALEANDTFPPLDRIRAIVLTGATGTNVNDLYFALRNPGG